MKAKNNEIIKFILGLSWFWELKNKVIDRIPLGHIRSMIKLRYQEFMLKSTTQTNLINRNQKASTKKNKQNRSTTDGNS